MWKSYLNIMLNAAFVSIGLLCIIAYQGDTDPAYFTSGTTGPTPSGCIVAPTGPGTCQPTAACPADVLQTDLRNHKTIIDVLGGASASAGANTGFSLLYVIVVGVLWIFMTLHDVVSVNKGRAYIWTGRDFAQGCMKGCAACKKPAGLCAAVSTCYCGSWFAKSAGCGENARTEIGKFPGFGIVGGVAGGGASLFRKSSELVSAVQKPGENPNLLGTLLRALLAIVLVFLLLVVNLLYWAAVFLPICAIFGSIPLLMVYIIAPLFVLVVGVMVFSFYAVVIGGCAVIVILILIFHTFRHPLKMALFNTLWPLLVILALLAALFFDCFVALGGSGGGELLFGTVAVTLPAASGSCACDCKYSVNTPKLMVLLILTGFAILWMLIVFWNAIKNFAKRGAAYHKLLTVTYSLPVEAVIQLQERDPAIGISTALLTKCGISTEKYAPLSSPKQSNAAVANRGTMDFPGQSNIPMTQPASQPTHVSNPSVGGQSNAGGYAVVPAPPPMSERQSAAGYGIAPSGDDGGYRQPPPPPGMPSGYNPPQAYDNQDQGGYDQGGYDQPRQSAAAPPEAPAMDYGARQSTASQAGGGAVPDAPPI